VYGPDRQPVAGAAVALGEPGGDERVATTDARGRFSVLDVPPGTWSIRVTSKGFLPSQGIVRVGGPGGPLEIELRSIDEGSPRAAEENPGRTALGWIERGNALLEQGRTAAARAEYEKALGVLALAERPPVLLAVARTLWLESRADESVHAIEQALIAEPTSADALGLHRTVLRELGREAEIDRFLADLPARAAAARAAAAAAEVAAAHEAPEVTEPPAIAEPPPAPTEPVPHRTGEVTLRSGESHVLASIAEVASRYGTSLDELRTTEPEALSYDLARESFDLFVPDAYRAGEAWGVVVWVSPGDRGGLRNPQARALLGERRLLWIGANRSGNRRSRYHRAALALDALHLAQRLYDVDAQRVFVAGYSGGGRMASHLAFLYAEVFRGGVCWFGVDHFAPVAVPFRPGHSWPASFPAPQGRALEELRRRGRFALVTGSRDFNRSETRAVHDALREQGFDGAAYFEIPDADHYHGLDAEWLDRALEHLELEVEARGRRP
jgi:predicted esterase